MCTDAHICFVEFISWSAGEEGVIGQSRTSAAAAALRRQSLQQGVLVLWARIEKITE